MPKKAKYVAVIDVAMVVVRTNDLELAVETANKVQIEPQINTQEAVVNVKLGKVLAQKPAKNTITSQLITLTDSVFIPVLAKILQGGEITTDSEGNETYTPPLVGSGNEGEIFELDVYGAVYDAAGKIVKYEKTTYPNCQGSPITETLEDNVFRVSEYTITSAAEEGQAPYTRVYVAKLPEIVADEGTEVAGYEEHSVGETTDETGLTTV